jgi:OPA family glycerol-3-phosphate transporter-like MFS transporter
LTPTPGGDYIRRMSVPATSTSLPLPSQFQDPAFRRRRTQNWVVLGLLYAFFYMTRYNFAASMGILSATFGWTNTELGVFETVLPLIYGLSVLVNGPLADRIGGKRAFLVGAVGVAVMNVLFGLETLLVRVPAVVEQHGHHTEVITPAVLGLGLSAKEVLVLMAATWAVNGYFQSFGAVAIVKVNAQWFHLRERGTFAGIFGVLIRAGLLLAFQGVPLITSAFGLAWGFIVPAGFVAALFVGNLLFVASSPRDAGFEDMPTGDATDSTGEGPASLTYVLRKVFTNRVAWIIALGSMMIGIVRRSSVDSWFTKYFTNVHLHPGETLASSLPYTVAVWGIALAGIAGGFAFGITSDKVLGGRRAPVITLGFVGMAVTLAVFGLCDRLQLGPWPAALLLPIMSFFVNGSHGMIGGAASMDFGGKKAAATAAGLFDGIQYLASAPFVGYGMGRLLDSFGWSVWQWAPIPFAVLGALIVAQIWHVAPGGKASPQPAAAPAATGTDGR